MAFPAYSYPGYQSPYYPQPMPDMGQMRQNQWPLQNLQQQSSQLGTAQVSPTQPNNGLIWVNNRQEADNFMVVPGSAVALWDANDSVLYLRQADSTGKPSTTVYDLVKRTADSTVQQQNDSKIDLSRYLTRDQVEELIEDRLEDRLSDLLTERLKKPVKATGRKETD